MSSYGYSKKILLPFDEAVDRVKDAYAKSGFGILCDIDVKEKFKEKLGIEYQNYRILGMCNPARAHEALGADPEIGLLLPCNVIVYEKEDTVIVSTVRPTALLGLVDDPVVAPIAGAVEELLIRSLNSA